MTSTAATTAVKQLRTLTEPLVLAAAATTSAASSHPLLQQQQHLSNNNNVINTSTMKKTILVAMSGGVDSSVAAVLLQQQLNRLYSSASSSGCRISSSLTPSPPQLIGIHMSNWDRNASEDSQDDHDQALSTQATTKTAAPSPPPPCQEQDYKDAKAVASTLGIPLQHVSFGADYWTLVFEPYCHHIAQGMTPNPDTACNTHIKFGSLLEFVSRKWGHDHYLLATGHYARLWHRQVAPVTATTTTTSHNDTTILPPPPDVQEALDQDSALADWIIHWGRSLNNHDVLPPLLLSALDKSKDQSYFLSGVPSRAFQNVLFPLGDLMKNDPDFHATVYDNHNKTNHQPPQHHDIPSVRALAQAFQLPTASKKDSVGLCFVGKRRKFPQFLQPYLPSLPPGTFINVDDGQVIGHHDGPGLLLTVGQGAKIPGASAKWFVVGRHPTDPSTIFVGAGTDHPALYTHTFQVSKMNWMAGVPPPPLLLSSHNTTSRNTTTRTSTMSAWCRARHLYDLVACDLEWDMETHVLTVHAHAPLRAVTPGQTLVVYVGGEGLICLGGGPIATVGPSYHDLGLTVTHKVSSPTSTFASRTNGRASTGAAPDKADSQRHNLPRVTQEHM